VSGRGVVGEGAQLEVEESQSVLGGGSSPTVGP
jgi:hypothetical protein